MTIDLATLENKIIYYYCTVCNNIEESIYDSGNIPVCCGKTMKRLIPGTSDGAVEKHVPVITVESNKVIVSVGSEPHPMTSEHYIQWITLQTTMGVYRKQLHPFTVPKAEFLIQEDEQIIAAYSFCNLHMLWMTEPTDS